jgi:hypothetical protein
MSRSTTMPKLTRWQQGFDSGALACIVAMLRLQGWHVKETAAELLRDFKPDMKTANDDDLAVLREFQLIN